MPLARSVDWERLTSTTTIGSTACVGVFGGNEPCQDPTRMLWQRQPPSRGTEWAKQSGDSQAPHNEYETSRILSVGDRVSSHVPVGLATNASTSYTYDTVIDTTSIQVHKRFSHRRGRPGNRLCPNAFGIVVAYALQVYLQGEAWGGTCTYNAAEQNDKLMAAARDFAEYNPDEKADITLMTETAMGGLLDTGFLVYYSGQSPPPAS
ncbi:FAD-binding domain-containing protein [Apiospora kogelbergensis]|uniref:FAD-binding domain-containing protein n=1 Tax=Apiospora kogelbergensis TaxID=1337665 RepID=A0AAW0QL41_9PEZI